MKVYKAPENWPQEQYKKDKIPTIFLAGSIEMGKAENWQEKITENLKDFNVVLLNPRRDDWDSSWKQSIEDEKFSEQVNWELDSLENCEVIVMYFDPNTKSPISLLELGLFARSGKLAVICPEGFWRKGNVDITCEKYKVTSFKTIDDFINKMKSWLKTRE